MPTPAASPTPAGTWRNKLNGHWVHTLVTGGTTEYVIDLDAYTIERISGDQSRTVSAVFDYEEGQTVYVVIFDGIVTANPFRFVTEDEVHWETGAETLYLYRK